MALEVECAAADPVSGQVDFILPGGTPVAKQERRAEKPREEKPRRKKGGNRRAMHLPKRRKGGRKR